MWTDVAVTPNAALESVSPRTGLEGPRRLRTAVHSCFVMSRHADRRAQLAGAAADAGWDTLVCDDAQEAREALRYEPCALTLLDIQDATLVEFAEMKRVAELAVGQPGHLLVVCGNSGDPREELWARQAGAWLYLPGVDEECDLTMVCQEARTVIGRLAAHREARVS
ncbi:MAG TPA: hypothetical protein VIY86_13240 [Pirellulaceae bacterium]